MEINSFNENSYAVPTLIRILDEKINTTGDCNLSDFIKELKGNKIHLCPKCKGYGYISKEYNSYPSGLPDSGWVYKPAYKKETCDLCNGVGWTEKEYKERMKMVSDGFYEVE